MFSCVCFVHIPHVKWDKLDKKAIPRIFVGFNSDSKAYKMYHPQTGKMVITRDVHFNEDEQWDREDSPRIGRLLQELKGNSLGK